MKLFKSKFLLDCIDKKHDMRKKIVSLTALYATAFVSAQVGISTTAPKSTLDVTKNSNFATNGLLIPRLTSAEITVMPVGADQNSMMVYLVDVVPAGSRTGAYVNMDTPAHYYYDGVKNIWVKFLDTDTGKIPSGLERLPSPTATADFGWRYIGANPTQYGTVGQFASDLSWNPTDMSLPFPLVGSYSTALEYSGLALADMGALAQGSFVSGSLNSSKGPFSSLLGAGNSSTAAANFSFAAGALNKVQNNYASAFGAFNTSTGTGSLAAGEQNTASGNNSVSLGNNNTSSGGGSFAVGQTNISSGENSIALGNSNTASGSNSIAMGIQSKATADNAFALGQGAKATTQASVAIGPNAQAQALNSFAIGPDTSASGQYAFAMGNATTAAGLSSFSLGHGTRASNMSGFSIGQFNTVDGAPEPGSYTNMAKRLFTIGNGSSDASRSDAFMVLRNGKVGINFDNFENTTNSSNLQVNGSTQTQGFGASFKFGNTILESDYTVVLNANAALPTSNTSNQGKIYVICSDGSARTLSGSLQDSGGAYTNFSLGTTAGTRCLQVQSVGDGRWWIIGRN